MSPTQMGFPEVKDRLAIFGASKGLIKGRTFAKCLQYVFENPLPVQHTWRDFVGMDDREIPWVRVGCLPTADENAMLMQWLKSQWADL